MAKKPTYKRLYHRVKELEKEVDKRQRAQQALQEAHDDLEVRVKESFDNRGLHGSCIR